MRDKEFHELEKASPLRISMRNEDFTKNSGRKSIILGDEMGELLHETI